MDPILATVTVLLALGTLFCIFRMRPPDMSVRAIEAESRVSRLDISLDATNLEDDSSSEENEDTN